METDRKKSDDNQKEQEKSLIFAPESGIELVSDPEMDNLITLLSQPTQDLNKEEYDNSIAKRQEAVSKFLLRGSAKILERLVDKIKQLEAKRPVKLDLSTLEVSGKILSGLYLPGANLDKLIFTGSDISGSDITGSSLTEAVAPRAKMCGITATGSNWTSAVIPEADMCGGRFIGCVFINTVMSGIRVDRETNFAGALFIGTYLGHVDLSIPNMTGAVFRGIRR
jgi:uncharacterized protein YjbI with pentapeptide repeats